MINSVTLQIIIIVIIIIIITEMIIDGVYLPRPVAISFQYLATWPTYPDELYARDKR